MDAHLSKKKQLIEIHLSDQCLTKENNMHI